MRVKKYSQSPSPDPRVNERFVMFRMKYIDTNQVKAAEALKISQSMISMIENSQRGVSMKLINKLQEVYKLNPEWLISGNGYQIREAEYVPNTHKRKNEDLEDRFARLEYTQRQQNAKQSKVEIELMKLQERIEELESVLKQIRTPDVHQK